MRTSAHFTAVSLVSPPPAAPAAPARPPSGPGRPRLAARLLAALCGLVLLLALPLPSMAADPPQRWSLSDADGRGWGLILFEQPDPAYPEGWRLRLNAGRSDLSVDHQRPLRLRDDFGGAWTLRNRSPELVPPGGAPLPAGSAQFDADDLVPRPSGALPLQLSIPLADGRETSITLGPEVAAALNALPSAGGSPG